LANYTYDEIGFGIYEKRQAILEKAVNKMSEIFHPVFDWWQALLAINHDNEKCQKLKVSEHAQKCFAFLTF